MLYFSLSSSEPAASGSVLKHEMLCPGLQLLFPSSLCLSSSSILKHMSVLGLFQYPFHLQLATEILNTILQEYDVYEDASDRVGQ